MRAERRFFLGLSSWDDEEECRNSKSSGRTDKSDGHIGDPSAWQRTSNRVLYAYFSICRSDLQIYLDLKRGEGGGIT